MDLFQRKLHPARMALIFAAAALALTLVAGAWAESPPNPPSRFVGNVTVNGAPATAGTTIEAKIGSTTCGTTTVFISGSEARYVLDSPALDPGANPNCGTDGAAVTFFVGGQKANETGSWKNYQLNTVNLSVTPAATTPSGTAPTVTATPRAPSTGNSGAADTTPAGWYLAVAMLGVLGFAGAGFAVTRSKG
jgi:hypothetical protein